jgi:3,4-dihydroxy 2-butanone 4-phosphate synthase/GTP cyclohydrolase II
VIAEVVHDDGSMMRLHDLLRFGRRHGLAVVSIEDLVRYLDRRPSLGDARSAETAAVPLDGVGEGGAGQQGGDGQNGDEQVCTGTDPVRLPTPWGAFEARAWRVEGMEHLTLSAPSGDAAPLVRVHSECLTGDVLGSRRCDCGEQLTAALEHIAAHGGTLVYLRGHEGRGIGLFDKLRAYALQERGWDTVDANTRLSLPVDARDYAAAATILGALGCRRVRLLTNNPAKVSALEAHGIAVEQRVALQVPARDENAAYLRTKRERMSHLLTAPEASAPAAPPAPAVTCGPAYAASRRSVPEQTHRQTLTTTERTAL